MTVLKQFREQQGVTQAWLAQKLHIHRVTLARYESGETQPPESLYFQLAHIFRLPVEEVLPLADHVQVHS